MNIKIKNNNLISKFNKGFAVLFSVLFASFLITLGISIFTISLKEIQITTSVRDSQIAYYVADSARECAIYWDIKRGAFPTCLSDDCSFENPITLPITCNNSSPITLNFAKNVPTLTYSVGMFNFFQASSTSSSTPVSDIKIIKKWIPANQSVRTTIEARGHNTGIIGRRIERGIQQINN